MENNINKQQKFYLLPKQCNKIQCFDQKLQPETNSKH